MLSNMLFNHDANMIRLAADITADSVVDGPGLRTVIWTQGCIHNCPGCHNPQTHNCFGGELYSIDEVCKVIAHNQQNITLSGGDPVLQPMQIAAIAKFAKKQGLTVWMYTGFQFEYLLQQPECKCLLPWIDVIVDGKFDIKNRTSELKFRGSSNQRIIDVQQSIASNQVVEWKDVMDNICRNNTELF